MPTRTSDTDDVHAPADRVHDVELTVEESMQAIITSGVAVDPSATPA